VVLIGLIEYKLLEMTLTGRLPFTRYYGLGKRAVQVKQFPVVTLILQEGSTP
jgi:hypothetical protein